MVEPCDLIWISNYGFSGQEMWMEVWNGNPTIIDISISWIHLYWSGDPNGNLRKIDLNGNSIWQGEYPPPEAWITSFFSSTTLWYGPNGLSFFFQNDANSSGYWLETGFNNGCIVSGGDSPP